MRLEKPDMDICSTFVEYMTDYKYHNDYNRAEEMLRLSVKQETSLTLVSWSLHWHHCLPQTLYSGTNKPWQQEAAAAGGRPAHLFYIL
jgi:hypothetical protein